MVYSACRMAFRRKNSSEAFYQHLKRRDFVRSYRIMRCKPLEQFGAPLPKFDDHVEIEFCGGPLV